MCGAGAIEGRSSHIGTAPEREPIGCLASTYRERGRRLRLRLAGLKRHAAARGEDGKSTLAVAAGKASGASRETDAAWGLELALRRWYPQDGGNEQDSR